MEVLHPVVTSAWRVQIPPERAALALYVFSLDRLLVVRLALLCWLVAWLALTAVVVSACAAATLVAADVAAACWFLLVNQVLVWFVAATSSWRAALARLAAVVYT